MPIPESGETVTRIKIGEAAALTGVGPGRIRHYQRLGLLAPLQTNSGYRYFSADQLLRLLQIDMLRSLGMGLEEIRAILPTSGDRGSLRVALERHRDTLRHEVTRLEGLLRAVEAALGAPEASAESVAAYLASAQSTPRESLGIFGRLSTPLSEEAAQMWQAILGSGWDLPVPPILGRMLLPPRVTQVLERLARAEGNQQLFARVRELAFQILQLSGGGAAERAAARRLAITWAASFHADPLPPAVLEALQATVPAIPELEVLNQGFQLWAESISPAAGLVLRTVQSEARRHGQLVLGVLLVDRPQRSPGSRPA